MGRAKQELEDDWEAGDCPECGAQCTSNDEGSYCSACDVTYAGKCSSCGHPMNGEGPECSACLHQKMSSKD